VFATSAGVSSIATVLGIAPERVEETLCAIADQSLIRVESRDTAEPRFSMLETVREYARERLAEDGQSEHLRARHAEHFLAVAEAAEAELTGPRQATTLNLLELEHDNLRAAHDHFQARGQVEEALRLAAALGRFWRIRGHLAEGRARFGDVMSTTVGAAAVRAKALREAGWLARDQGDYATARAYSEESLAIASGVNDRLAIGRALLQLGFLRRYEGDPGGALGYYERALSSAREAGDEWCVAASLGSLGLLARDGGDAGTAERHLEASLRAATSTGDTLGIAWALTNLGLVARASGSNDTARAMLERALETWTDLGDRQNIAYCLHNIGLVELAEGNVVSSHQRQEESIRMLEEVGDRRGIAFVLESFAMIAAAGQDHVRAVTLSGAAAALRAALSSAPPLAWRDECERALRPARVALGTEAVRQAADRGAGMELKEAIDYACQRSPE